MNLQKEIVGKIKNSLPEILESEIRLNRPTDTSHGDFTTNIAMVAAKKLGKRPIEIANELKDKLENIDGVEKVEVAPPGFINFFVAKAGLLDNLLKILEKSEDYGKSEKLKGKKIMLEYADPNPFKEFHIGHLRNISLGESYARLSEAQGADFWRVNYQGDVGLHVAKAIWGIQNSKRHLAELENKPLKTRVEFLGKAYTAGAKAYEEDAGVKKEITSINLGIYKNDPDLQEIWKTGRKWSLEYFEEIYKRVGTTYKRYYFESEVADKGRQIVLDNIENGIFERHEEAVVFRGGDHTRVFVTKEDYATYEAKDMALAGVKYEDFKYDKSVIITAHEQGPYFKVVLAAMGKVFPELAKKTSNITFGFVRLKDEKMSSRLGNIISGEWLLDEVKVKIAGAFPEMDDKTLEMVAVGAVKYSMLKFGRTSDIAFTFEDSISLEGNSGPYIQYTFARCCSVLQRAGISNFQFPISNSELEKGEVELIRMLSKFGEVVEEAGNSFSPNILCNYLFELSQKFNLFYQKHKIIGGDKEEFRLALTKAVGQVIKNGLYLLGIESPEKM